MSRDAKAWVAAAVTAFATWWVLVVVLSAAGAIGLPELAIILVIASSFAVLAFGLTERRL